MFVALDNSSGKAILGYDVETGEEQLAEKESDNRYDCIICGSPLDYDGGSNTTHFNYFVHDEENDCINDGNLSDVHRLGQEVAAKILFNWLPQTAKFDLEKRIGTRSNFVITDIEITGSARVAIEIFYRVNQVGLRRRLSTLFEMGYSVMLIFVSSGRISPKRVQHYLGKIYSIRIGEFEPNTLDLTLGTLISPGQIDLEKLEQNSVPEYLV